MNALTVQNPQPQVIEKQDNNTINYICILLRLYYDSTYMYMCAYVCIIYKLHSSPIYTSTYIVHVHAHVIPITIKC